MKQTCITVVKNKVIHFLVSINHFQHIFLYQETIILIERICKHLVGLFFFFFRKTHAFNHQIGEIKLEIKKYMFSASKY